MYQSNRFVKTAYFAFKIWYAETSILDCDAPNLQMKEEAASWYKLLNLKPKMSNSSNQNDLQVIFQFGNC